MNENQHQAQHLCAETGISGWDLVIMKQVEHVLDRMALALNGHIQFKIYEDHAISAVHMLARTKPVPAMDFILRSKTSFQPCFWVSHRWAKTIRWILGKKWLRWCVPYPIEALVHATEVIIEPVTERFSEKVIDNIQAQIAELLMNGKEPTQIIVGMEVATEAIRGIHMSVMPVGELSHDGRCRLFGYPLLATYKLTKDSVIVV